MKKTEIKKLQLSRETLQNLEDSETRKVAGGISAGSCQSQFRCVCLTDSVC